jgi:oxalate decarboxylase/phosphoglucose isomerase-like protein (cupin superfamily)
MRGMSTLGSYWGLIVCLLTAAGCTAGRDTPETGAACKPFVHGLEDPCDYHLLLTGKPQTCGMRSGRVRLAPGRSIGLHSTKGNEELLVFFSGEGIALLGEDTQLQVGAGRVAYIPPQTTHDIRNTGAEPLVYVFCVAPAATGSD